MSSFNIGGNVWEFPDSFNDYGIIMRRLNEQANEQIKDFDELYESCNDIEKVVANGKKALTYCVCQAFLSFKQLALRYGIYDFGKDTFYNHRLSYDVMRISYSALENVEEQLNAINSDEANTKARREMRKECRGRVVGGGFGLGGAIKGMAMAGAINAGTGLLHGSFNMVGNIFTSMSASSSRSSLYRTSKPYLREALRESIHNLLPLICDVFHVNAPVDKSREQSILKNIVEGAFGDFDLQKPFYDAFRAYPFDGDLYKAYLSAYPQHEQDVVAMGKHFGIDLTEFIQGICVINGFAFSSLVVANGCMKLESEFSRKIADLTNEDFAMEVLQKNYWSEHASPLLIVALIEHYSEDVEVSEDCAEVLQYRRKMYEELCGIADEKGYAKTVALPYTYGNIRKNLTFILGVFSTYMIEHTNLKGYIEFLSNDALFRYECSGSIILIDYKGIMTKELLSALPSNDEEIRYEKDFIGSTLYISDKSFAYATIGNAMSVIVDLLRAIKEPYHISRCLYHLEKEDMLKGEVAVSLGNEIVQDDPKAAYYYYAMAALSDMVEWQLKLAQRYEAGGIVNQDYALAKYWYERAAANGSAEAQQEMDGKEWSSVDAATEDVAVQSINAELREYIIKAFDMVNMPAWCYSKPTVEEAPVAQEEAVSAAAQEDAASDNGAVVEAQTVAADSGAAEEQNAEADVKYGDRSTYLAVWAICVFGMPYASDMLKGMMGEDGYTLTVLVYILVLAFVVYRRIVFIGKTRLLFLLSFVPWVNVAFWLYLIFPGKAGRNVVK